MTWADPAPVWYIPKVAWQNDALSFDVVIPPQDYMQDNPKHTKLLNVKADGTSATALAEFNIAHLGVDTPHVSPSGNKVAYLTFNKGVLGLNIYDGLSHHFIKAIPREAFETFTIWAWSPDSGNLFYWLDSEQVHIIDQKGQ